MSTLLQQTGNDDVQSDCEGRRKRKRDSDSIQREVVSSDENNGTRREKMHRQTRVEADWHRGMFKSQVGPRHPRRGHPSRLQLGSADRAALCTLLAFTPADRAN